MTPKEKAIELVDRYSDILFDEIEGYYQRNHIIKLCALIAVDEIIAECRVGMDWFWQEVKQEINGI